MAEDQVAKIGGEVSEDDKRRAKTFFDKGRALADSVQYDYAIEMYLNGMAFNPDDPTAHQALRDISLKRRANGGKSLGMFDAMKIKRPTKDDKQNLLNAEKLLSFDPGNSDYMLAMIQSAHKAGYIKTVLWVGPILSRATADDKRPDFNKFIILKDIYKDLSLWKEASDAAHQALNVRPNDMELQTELKNLGAQDAMGKGNYGGDSRGSLRNSDETNKLMEGEKSHKSLDAMERAIVDAEAEWRAEPNEMGKLSKYVDALVRTEQMDYENRALEVLDEAFKQTQNFRFRFRSGMIQIAQMRRMERSKKAELDESPNDEVLKKDYADLKHDQIMFELDQYKLFADNYPTDLSYRYEIALRLFELKNYDEAIPVFQHARTDPKLKFKAALYLGLSFLEAGYVDEAIETLRGAIGDHQGRGDDLSLLLYYWCGRALEKKNDRDEALKHFSRVAQWNFNYKDVQARIKKLRVTHGG